MAVAGDEYDQHQLVENDLSVGDNLPKDDCKQRRFITPRSRVIENTEEEYVALMTAQLSPQMKLCLRTPTATSL